MLSLCAARSLGVAGSRYREVTVSAQPVSRVLTLGAGLTPPAVRLNISGANAVHADYRV